MYQSFCAKIHPYLYERRGEPARDNNEQKSLSNEGNTSIPRHVGRTILFEVTPHEQGVTSNNIVHPTRQ